MKAGAKEPLASVGGPLQQAEPISYRRLLQWALLVVGYSWPLFLASLILGVLPIVLGQYSVSLLARIISLIGQASVDSHVVRLAVMYACIALLAIALQFSSRMANIRSNAAMLGALQQRLHDKLLAMSTAYHDTHDLGETTTIVLQDAAGCQPMLRELVAFPLTQGVALISAIYFLIQGLSQLQSVPLGAELALAIVVVAVPPLAWRLSSGQRQAYGAVRNAQAALTSEFANSATTPTEVQLLGAETQRSRAFARRLGTLVAARIRAQSGMELSNQFQTSVPTLLQVGFLTYAAIAAARAGSAAAGAILSIYYFVPKVIEPVDQIIRFLGGLEMLWMQAARMGVILDAPDEPAAAGAPALHEGNAAIGLEHVGLRFAGTQTPVLRDLTHVFPAGRVSALVGRSGSGKSTILSLIDGVREPDSGTVSIGGRPISSLDRATLRAMVAVVSQSPLFISDTVRANFQLARADASDAEIEEAARATGVWPALVKLGGERPLDVEVPRTPGRGLSGGERRLLAVARVLLRRPKIMLLDEPTTGVDQLSMGVLLDGLRGACAGLTVVMVEHNLDFVRSFAGQVCCLQDGRFADIGMPDELAARPSLFSELLAAREALTSTAHLEVRSLPMPSLAPGQSVDPFSDAPLPKAGGPKRGLPVSTTAIAAT